MVQVLIKHFYVIDFRNLCYSIPFKKCVPKTRHMKKGKREIHVSVTFTPGYLV